MDLRLEWDFVYWVNLAQDFRSARVNTVMELNISDLAGKNFRLP